MFERGLTAKIMIGLSFSLTGFLAGLGVQPTPGVIWAALAMVALFTLAIGVLALERHSYDERKRGQDLPTRDNAHVLS